MSILTTHDERQVARPLKVLVALIKEDLRQAEEAADRAATPYYIAAGEKMLEAKGQLDHGEFEAWIKRNFDITLQHARRYMSAANTTRSQQNERARIPTTLSDFIRESGGAPRGSARGGAAVHEAVKQIMSKVDVDTLNIRQAELKRAEEREAERKLATQLIDIGYKALATKLHPDKGGSRDAMSRLNRVRDRLKQHI